jgi:ribonuclease BN (tRNA processing enzyme)
VRLTVVGDAPAWTRRAGHASSCYLVQHRGAALVLDFGQGAFSALAQYVAPESIDGVLISHLHADHLVDLIPLRHYLTYEAETGAPRLRGPAELPARFDAFQAHTGMLDCLAPAALEPGTFELAGFTIEARHVTHIPDSYAFRISVDGAGPGLVYSGDCGIREDLLPLVREDDVLLCEAAYGASAKPHESIHLTAAEAGWVAQQRAAGRLILTHVQDRQSLAATLAAARGVFGGESVLAEPGLAVDIA